MCNLANLALLDSSSRLVEIIKKLIDGTVKKEDVGESFLAALIQFDSSLAILYEQLYIYTFSQTPVGSGIMYRPNLERLGLDGAALKRVRNVRNTRNNFSHSFDFGKELLAITITKNRLYAFKRLVKKVVLDLHSLRSEIRELEMAAA